MVHFDLSMIPVGSTVSSAKLHMWVVERKATLNQDLIVHALTQAWDEDRVTWVKRSGENWSVRGGAYGSAQASKAFAGMSKNTLASFSIPVSVVQAWVNTPSSNYGFLLKPTSNGDPGSAEDTVVFASSEYPIALLRPKLEIAYTSSGNTVPVACVAVPQEHAVTRPGFDLEIQAGARDPDGTLTNVQILAAGDVLADKLASPYAFTWKTVPAGDHALTARAWDDSGAVRTSSVVTVRSRWTVYAADMDTNPGWSLAGQWGYGQPQGRDDSYGHPDPSSGYTGAFAVGYNLAGAYAAVASPVYATMPVIDCSDYASTRLDFRYWLGVEGSTYDHASVEISRNGTLWQSIWENPVKPMAGGTWRRMSLDISAVADGESSVYIRWGMGPCDSAYHYGGWNIDDVLVTGVRTGRAPDKDGDSIGDDWELYYFGGSQAAPGDDDDHDGASNLAEWLGGTDPSSASDRLACAISVENGESVITFPMAPPGPFHSGYTRTYRILTRDSLRSGVWYEPVGSGDIPAAPGQARVNLGPAGKTGNYRVSVKID